jgi:formamidopyrimidine-DNA glycosylase
LPELPEAETIARGLNAALAGQRVKRLRVHRSEVVEPMTPAAFRKSLSGRQVLQVGRRAKWIAATLDDGKRWVTQLRMNCRFTWSHPSPLRVEPHLSVSILFENSNAGVLRFFDVRRFARMWVVSPEAWSELDGQLGIEPLSRRFTPKSLERLLSASKAPIRNLLLDQRRVAGVGNIYANEACYMAGIDPRRPAASLNPSEAGSLYSAIRRVLREAVNRRGTSFSDYRDVLGGRGEFQNVLAVYGRAGEVCRRCGGEIVRVVLTGRSAFYCSGCQR